MNGNHESPHQQQPRTGAWLLLGSRGSGMQAFGRILHEAGETVIGMDLFASATNIINSVTHHEIPWTDTPDWTQLNITRVVASLAVPDDAPILHNARARRLPVQSLPEALAERLIDTHQICIAGTHGKSTTSAMTAFILDRAGVRLIPFVGADLCEQPLSRRLVGSPDLRRDEHRISVIESCEYRRTFLAYQPQTAVLTGIEGDHFDCFTDDADADEAYLEFLSQTRSGGTIVANADCSRTRAVIRRLDQNQSRRLMTFSFHDPRSASGQHAADANITSAEHWHVRALSEPAQRGFAWQQRFVLQPGNDSPVAVQLPVVGDHNIANAVAALLAVREHGIGLSDAAAILADFPGLRRRFENRGVIDGVQYIDDYAHHPTAIRVTLSTARRVFPGRRLLAVCEPHQMSRLVQLSDEFADALRLADECLILPVLPAREQVSGADCLRASGRLVRAITARGGRALLMANLDQVPRRLDHAARPGDVVITLGAGRTDQIHDEIAQRLRRDTAA